MLFQHVQNKHKEASIGNQSIKGVVYFEQARQFYEEISNKLQIVDPMDRPINFYDEEENEVTEPSGLIGDRSVVEIQLEELKLIADSLFSLKLDYKKVGTRENPMLEIDLNQKNLLLYI